MPQPTWTTALPDWEERILAGRSLVPVAPLFPEEAEASMGVLKELRLRDAGGITIGQASKPWFLDFASAIFGAYNPQTGRRLISEFMLLISKKNGKSSSAAGIMLTALIRNWRESAEFLILAPTVEAANSAYKPAADMIGQDEELKALLQVQDYHRTITHRKTGASLKVVAADAQTVTGKKATGVLVDELWEFGKQSGAMGMLTEATGGLASRPEGFVIYLSTQSDEPPAGIFEQKLAYARGVRDGKIVDPQFMPVLYEFPAEVLKDEKHLQKEFFFVTNPNLGASVDELFLERKLKQASIDGEAALKDFLAKHLNVQISMAMRAGRWVGADYWVRRGRPEITLDHLIKQCEVVTVGIDGGGLDDLLGLAIIGRERETRHWLAWYHAWAHRIVLERRKSIATQLLDFEKDGDLTLVDDPGDDVIAVADIVCRIHDLGLLPEKLGIGVDASGINDIVEELTSPARGISMDMLIAISQGWKLMAAIKTTERRLAGGDFFHSGSRLMTFCASNAMVEPKGNAILITKAASGTAKIDPLMAGFNAVELLSRNPEASGGRSFWERAA